MYSPADLAEPRVAEPRVMGTLGPWAGRTVALLTGGGDTPYAYGLATALTARRVSLDLIAGNDLDRPEFHGTPYVNFLNLRGNQDPAVSPLSKVLRVLLYYCRLIRYAALAEPKIFHILWNNKLELLDRTLVTLYYKILGKKVILTVHNVNAGRRDSTDTALNRLTLRIQYRLADHIFVHTDAMKRELVEDFSVRASDVTVIPFGINNAVPITDITPAEARQRLGIGPDERALLFFGTIVAYKGLEHLLAAFERLLTERDDYRLIIAGRPRKDSEKYWASLEPIISRLDQRRITQNITFIPDEDTELYFKAADVVILPYTQIFQSGVLFLGYSFGLPAIAADVGSLKDDIIEGETGFVFRAKDAVDLAKTVDRYFSSELFKTLPSRRSRIRDHVAEQHSWDTVGQMTQAVYASVLGNRFTPEEVRR
jgi:D-inositol-3-phosphate glycosyltransferase